MKEYMRGHKYNVQQIAFIFDEFKDIHVSISGGKDSTVESGAKMNRIKGLHQVEKMSDLVVKLESLGLEDTEIASNLGMEPEELIRLKQQLGIAHAFKNVEYSNSWEI